MNTTTIAVTVRGRIVYLNGREHSRYPTPRQAQDFAQALCTTIIEDGRIEQARDHYRADEQ
jgi:hypothetical protein